MTETGAITTQQRIIDLALERFLTQGYSNVSVDEISKTLRISKKTLYKSFRGKKVLLAESVDHHLASCKAEVEAIVAGEGNFISKLEQLLALIHQRFGWLEPHAIADLQHQAPDVWQNVVNMRKDTLSKSLVLLLEEGKQEGSLKQDLESPLIVEMMVASLEVLTLPQMLATQAKSVPQMVSFVVNTFLEGSKPSVFG